LALFVDGSLSCHPYIAPIISYPHAHIQVRPLVDSPAGRKAVDILLCIVNRQRTLMKGDKVVELLEKCTNLLLLSVSGNHIPSLM